MAAITVTTWGHYHHHDNDGSRVGQHEMRTNVLRYQGIMIISKQKAHERFLQVTITFQAILYVRNDRFFPIIISTVMKNSKKGKIQPTVGKKKRTQKKDVTPGIVQYFDG